MNVAPSPPRRVRRRSQSPGRPPQRKIVKRPLVFSHFVLNLPASALTFLPSFIGLYAECELLFQPYADRKLPIVHVYCFHAKSDDEAGIELDICREISEQIGFSMVPASSMEIANGICITDVRDIAPSKRMFCASFRIPPAVAYKRS